MKPTRYILISAFLVNAFINSTNAQNISPVKTETGSYVFNFANVRFEINPAYGGRIASLKMNAEELLFQDFKGNPNSPDNVGSTFWPSPQSAWNWPPPAEINNEAYIVESADKQLVVTSKINQLTGLSITKIYSVNPADTSVSVEYIMKNNLDTARWWAPWEITRVKANGLSFWALGSGKVSGNIAHLTKVLGNNVWYCQDSTSVPTEGVSKFMCDGKGWLAHKTQSRYLIIKSFPDVLPEQAAKGEAEVEFFTSPDHAYTEVENQGLYVKVEAGKSLSWKVKWYIRLLPADIKGVSGEEKLLTFVYQTLNHK
jgi:hypothetical protein